MTRQAVELPGLVRRNAGVDRIPGGRRLLTLLLLAGLVWSLAQVEWQDGVVRTNGLSVLTDLVGGLVRPSLSPQIVSRALRATWVTVVYAVAGMTLAIGLGLPFGVFASGTIASDRARRLTMLVGRGTLAAMRSVHELVWAWLFVVVMGLSPFAAVLAIGIPYAGILGRIYADLLNDVSTEPLLALRSAGATRVMTLLWGRMPMALPDLISYSSYRFECALRASAIMGFIGLGGLGFEIQTSLADLHYRDVGTYLASLVLLVTVVDAWSSVARREMAS